MEFCIQFIENLLGKYYKCVSYFLGYQARVYIQNKKFISHNHYVNFQIKGPLDLMPYMEHQPHG